MTNPSGGSAGYVWRLTGIASLFLGASTLTVALDYSGLTFGKASLEDVKEVVGEFRGCQPAKADAPPGNVDASKWAEDAVTRCTVISTELQDKSSSIEEEFVFQNGVLRVVKLTASDEPAFERLVGEVSKEYSEYARSALPFSVTPGKRLIVILSDPLRVGPGVDPPKLVERFEPAYPEEVRRARLEGVVIVEAVISAAGGVEDVKVLKTPAHKLSELAVHAISRWKYRPATLDGDPVPVHLTVSSTFSLNSGSRIR